METITGWHFTGDRLRNGDPIPPVGEWIRAEGTIVLCRNGLHCSKRLMDALHYAPGELLHRVELLDNLQDGGDKWVGRERRIIASADATNMLREFARWCALQVVHLWNVPPVVLEYLTTGDESKRAAAMDAAWDASRAAAMDAAWDASRAAATAAAWAASRDAAMDASRAAAWAASRDAAWAAAMDAAMDAARDTAWAAARAAQSDKLEEMGRRLLGQT
jgi:hypothetical protein